MAWACLAVLVAGCSTGVTQSDAESVKQEFSKENYEKAMRESGKGAELEDQKKREAAYLQAGNAEQQDAEQH